MNHGTLRVSRTQIKNCNQIKQQNSQHKSERRTKWNETKNDNIIKYYKNVVFFLGWWMCVNGQFEEYMIPAAISPDVFVQTQTTYVKVQNP